ncbi:MAG: glycosyltransferase [Synechococcales bacterium]|nr:glycosyltransferase [Synechococcales bacterium]
MTLSQAKRRSGDRSSLLPGQQLHLTTLVVVGAIAILSLVAVAWFAGQPAVTHFFQQLHAFQEHPADWLQVPPISGYRLLVPTVGLLAFVQVVMRRSPQPQPWSRGLIAGLLGVLLGRYLLWRSLTTLNLATPLDGLFSLGLLAMELLLLGSGLIQLVLLFWVRDRRRQADQLAVDVVSGAYTPTVDVLIPTYDEPESILRRTVIGCQAMVYPRKRIYLLDDTHRPAVLAMAQQLGCRYLTRPDNRHAKAGNLNHAIAHTSGELIVVFDADFVPTQNFLTRTVGFFQDPTIALVQTPQSFYNPDPIAYNLGLEDVLTSEEEVFYRQIQPMRDGAGGVICAGTSFVVRRSALEALNGFVTESLSEDYFTGIRLAANGHRLVYLDEKLSAGLAAESITAQAIQRIRWAQGTLQSFFISANPLTIPGLRPIQRLAYLEGILHWFSSLARVWFLCMPLAYGFLQVTPLRVSPVELLYFFLPYYAVQIAVFSWLNYRSRSALLSDIYSLVLCFPLAWTVVRSLLSPFNRKFRVTPKGTQSDRFRFNWGLAAPLLVILAATVVSLGNQLYTGWLEGRAIAFDIGWFWSLYNLLMLSVSLLILLDAPRLPGTWLNLQRPIRLTLADPTAETQTFWGVSTQMSEVGMEIALNRPAFPPVPADRPLLVEVMVLGEAVTLKGVVIDVALGDDQSVVRVQFEALPLPQQRRLVALLFCRPGQWPTRSTPREGRSLLLLFQVLLKPRFLWKRGAVGGAIAVKQCAMAETPQIIQVGDQSR